MRLMPNWTSNFPMHQVRWAGALIGAALLAASLGGTSAGAEPPPGHSSARSFEKIVLTDKYYCDGIQAGDIDRDGHLDVVAGPFWYAGPAFREARAIYPPVALPPEKSPSDSMFSFVHDFSGDGWPDILVLGRVHLHPA